MAATAPPMLFRLYSVTSTDTSPTSTNRVTGAEPSPGPNPFPPPASASRFPRCTDWTVHLVLAAIAYIPVFDTHPGKLVADTKSYLYLNPGSVLRQAFYMWDEFIGNGTVTHQYIGYLFPMGPYYWVAQHLGVPMWIAQRFWLGSIFFAAGSGVLFCLRHLGVSGPGRPVASLAFMLTPYVLSYAARLSALLLPWAAIGWLVGFTALALRRGGWRYPALFALVALTAGTVNATSLIFAGFAPLLYVPYSIWVTRECSLRRGITTALKIAVLSLAVLAWSITGLAVEFAYALNIVVYTESIPTVTLTSTASEVIRGLGYWYFYGEDQIDHYIQAAPPYMTSVWYLLVGFSMPAAQFLLGIFARWRYTAYCICLVLAGTVLAVGAYPYAHSSPFGALLKHFQSAGIAGLALRSDNRAVPVILLGLAGLTASGVTALWERHRRTAALIGVVVAGGAVASLPSLWTGNLLGENLLFPSKLPAYYASYAHYLDTHDASTRVLDEPGDDFAYYTWGTTVDPVDPALIDRPFVAREQVPYGSAASADLLDDFDENLQEETFNPLSLAPVARLMSAGDVVLRSDLAYERYNTPRPQETWAIFDPPPKGIGKPIPFGKPERKKPSPYPLVDETSLAESPTAPSPPPLAVFPVTNTRPIVRTEPAADPLVVDGDGMGVVSAADAGLLDENDTLFYSATFAKKPAQLREIIHDGAELVVTDTNYLALRRWGTVRENVGYIQQPGEPVLVKDATAHSLPIFPGETTEDQTVAHLIGIKHVVATSYGNAISFVPENQPYNAFDGNLDTVWTTGAFANPVGQRIRAVLDRPVTADHLVLVQPLSGPRDRYITRITIAFGNGAGSRRSYVTVNLTHASRTSSGQTVHFSTRRFSTLEVRIDGINLIHEVAYAGVSGVGFAEIGIPGVNMREVIAMPSDLLRAAGPASQSHPLVFLMNRRQAPPVPPRTDPELSMTRQFTLPTSRSFSISGTARISALIPDQTIDQLMGRPGSDGSGVDASSSGRLPGDLNARASMALQNTPGTAWMPGIGPQAGGWIQVNLPATRSFDHLNLQVVADGRHSVPTRVTLSSASGADTVDLPPVRDLKTPNGTASVPISFPALTGSWLRLTIDRTRNVTYTDYYSGRPDIEPVGIAELGVPGLTIPPVPSQFPAVCRDDLIAIDGRPVSVEVTGSNATAASEQGTSLTFTGCGPDAHGITLGAGTHVLTTAGGYKWQFGIDIDTVDLASAAGGAPMGLDGSQLPSAVPAASPTLRVAAETPTSYRLDIAHPTGSFWLVLGESLNKGWRATITSVSGHPANIDLGSPTLIDAMSNGWLLDSHHADPSRGPLTVEVAWTPQEWVLPSLVFSAIAVAACLGLILSPRSRRIRVHGSSERSSSRTDTAASTPPPDGSCGATPPEGLAVEGAPPEGGSASGHPPPAPVRRSVVAAAGMAAIAGVFVDAWIALPVGVVVVIACRSTVVQKLLGIAGPVLLLGTGLYYAAEEAGYHWHALFGWPLHFQTGNTLAWLGILALSGWAAARIARLAVREEPASPTL